MSAPSLREHARSLLEEPDLEAKLRPPRDAAGKLLDDEPGGSPLFIEEPARGGPLSLSGGKADKLPKLSALGSSEARAVTLARFAHHELQAVELFAWALLAFPDAPPALRRGLALALEEEQQHLQLYLDRLAAHGARLGDTPLSGYFWHALPTNADATLPGFLAGQGLTLEQANLDFTLLYRDAFQRAGDRESAAVLQRVHRDEIGHVRLAYTWFKRLSGPADVVEAYRREVPFPLSAARAKGRRFERSARRKAGLDEALIDFVEQARPYQSARAG